MQNLNEDEQIVTERSFSLFDLIFIVWKRKWTVLALTGLTTLLFVVLSPKSPTYYKAQGVALVMDAATSGVPTTTLKHYMANNDNLKAFIKSNKSFDEAVLQDFSRNEFAPPIFDKYFVDETSGNDKDKNKDKTKEVATPKLKHYVVNSDNFQAFMRNNKKFDETVLQDFSNKGLTSSPFDIYFVDETSNKNENKIVWICYGFGATPEAALQDQQIAAAYFRETFFKLLLVDELKEAYIQDKTDYWKTRIELDNDSKKLVLLRDKSKKLDELINKMLGNLRGIGTEKTKIEKDIPDYIPFAEKVEIDIKIIDTEVLVENNQEKLRVYEIMKQYCGENYSGKISNLHYSGISAALHKNIDAIAHSADAELADRRAYSVLTSIIDQLDMKYNAFSINPSHGAPILVGEDPLSKRIGRYLLLSFLGSVVVSLVIESFVLWRSRHALH